MRIEVRCYGEVAAAVGESTVSLSLGSGASVGDAVAELGVDEADPSGGLVVMRNGRHADPDEALSDGDTVALSQAPMRE
ncbi:MoaD/ThiS family protein [Haloplanus halophilus]|uniref:MoaD/ThiS family protein n=1 Tax=Haloplanus halophilus TaxID=2949993 RepID=UPI00203FA7CF|nr:MoaD/ThiS family protein [Haloplanus sp. GDY1]